MSFRQGGWLIFLGVFVSIVTVLVVLLPRRGEPRREPGLGDGRNVATYGFDLSTALVDTTLIAAAGVARDRIRSLEHPPGMSPAEADEAGGGGGKGRGKYLVTTDRVVGVEIGGRARAYPLRILAWHEVVNDTLGGRAIAVTYGPITDAVVVFDRTVGGRAVEFGHSGLLYNHSLLLFERKPAEASLWSQLLRRAIAGPRAGERLEDVPFVLTHWGRWREQHPDTDVLRPDPSMFRQYRREPYVNYYGNDRLRDFPLRPEPPEGPLANKERVVSIERDGRRLTVPLSVLERRADPSGIAAIDLFGEPVRLRYLAADRPVAVPEETDGELLVIPSFWFARHAVTPDDSLYLPN